MLPNFNTLTPVNAGSSPNVDIAVRTCSGVNDNFGFVWEGYINITTPGNYTFETISDDGSKFYFNSFYVPGATPLISNDGLHAPNSATATVNIPTAGLYPIAVTFFEKDGGETLQLFWTVPGQTRQSIPNSAFVGGAPFSGGPIAMSGVVEVGATGDTDKGAEIKKLYPNPFVDNFTMEFRNSSAANDIRVGIYDMKGRLIYMHHAGNVAVGNTTLKVDLAKSRLPWGMYMVNLYVNGQPSKMMKLIKSQK